MTEGKIVTWLKNVGDKVSLLLFMPGDLVGVSFNSFGDPLRLPWPATAQDVQCYQRDE